MAPKKKKPVVEAISVTVLPIGGPHAQSIVEDLENKLFFACTKLKDALEENADDWDYDDEDDDGITLPGDLQAWYKQERDKREAAREEVKKRALNRLTPEEREVLGF